MANLLSHLVQNLRSLIGLTRARETRETAVLFSGNLTNKALTFLVHLVVIRTLSVREFALFGVAVMVLEVLVELSDLGLNLGLVRNYSLHVETNPQRANSMIRLILRAKVLWTLALSVGLYFLAPVLCRYVLKKEALTAFVQLAAAGLSGTVLVYFLLAHLQAARLFFRYVFLSMFGRVILVAAVALLAFSDHLSLATALSAYIFIPFATVVMGFILAPRDYLALRRLEPGVGPEVFHFGRWVMLASLLVLAFMRLDVFMLTAMSREEQIAYFVMAVRVASLLLVATRALATALLPHVGRFQTADQARAYMRRIFTLVPALAGVVLVLVLGARLLLVGLFGAKAEPAVAPFRILALAYSFSLVAVPASLVLYRISRADLICAMNAVQLFVCFTGNLILIPRFGAGGPALTALFIQATSTVYVLIAVDRSLGTLPDALTNSGRQAADDG